MLTRRSLIKALAALGGILLLPIDRLGRSDSGSIAYAQSASAGEVYAGFLLLPEGAPIPPTVRYPKLGIPIVGEAGVARDKPQAAAVATYMASEAALAKDVWFPMYTLRTLPHGFRRGRACVMRHHTGEVFAVGFSFESYSSDSDVWEASIGIIAEPEFPRPFPLWFSSSRGPEEPGVVLEKVDFLPSPGIMVQAGQGYVFCWIQKDILYRARIERECSRQEAQILIADLELVRG